jgi:aldehyde dehydrogenase family 7 protein A1
MGDPLDQGVLVGPIHSKNAVQAFEKAVSTAKEQGGKVLVGGEVLGMKGALAGGNWVQPTVILVDDVEKVKVMQQETFAPSLSFFLVCLFFILEC